MAEERRRRGGRSASGGRRRPSSSSSSSSSRAALRLKVRELRRLVPGGEEALAAGALLARTADYIVRLRARVHLLRALAAVYGVAAPPPLHVADADAGECMS